MKLENVKRVNDHLGGYYVGVTSKPRATITISTGRSSRMGCTSNALDDSPQDGGCVNSTIQVSV